MQLVSAINSASQAFYLSQSAQFGYVFTDKATVQRTYGSLRGWLEAPRAWWLKQRGVNVEFDGVLIDEQTVAVASGSTEHPRYVQRLHAPCTLYIAIWELQREGEGSATLPKVPADLYPVPVVALASQVAFAPPTSKVYC